MSQESIRKNSTWREPKKASLKAAANRSVCLVFFSIQFISSEHIRYYISFIRKINLYYILYTMSLTGYERYSIGSCCRDNIQR